MKSLKQRWNICTMTSKDPSIIEGKNCIFIQHIKSVRYERTKRAVVSRSRCKRPSLLPSGGRGLVWRGQNTTMTHTDIQQRMSPLTEWLTACSHTRLIPQHNAGLHTHTRTRKHVTFKFYHCYLTPQHCQSATNCDSHRITQCVALRRRHHASIVPRPEKEQGVRSSLGEAKDCERGRGDREGGRERGMTTGCVGEWTAHQAIGKVAPLAILSLPPQTQQSPDQLKMS